MILVHLRGNLECEAQNVVRRVCEMEVPSTWDTVAPGLAAGVLKGASQVATHSWHLGDYGVEKMIKVVTADLAKAAEAA
jgi:hypothetical protein